MADTVTLLDFPAVTDIQDDDIVYLVRGTGVDRDRTLPGSVLKSYLGETLVQITETGSINLSNYKTNVFIDCNPSGNIDLTVTGVLPGACTVLIANRSAFTVTVSIISTSKVLSEGNFAQYFSDAVAMHFLYANQTVQQMLDTIYPVGSFYVQYPDAASNDDATAFPVSARPATMFGGTWVEQFNTEGVVFQTAGYDGAERTNGLMADQLQGHIFTLNKGQAVSAVMDSAGAITISDKTPYGTGNVVDTGAAKTDGTNGTPRIGTKTSHTNRLAKYWKRTVL